MAADPTTLVAFDAFTAAGRALMLTWLREARTQYAKGKADRALAEKRAPIRTAALAEIDGWINRRLTGTNARMLAVYRRLVLERWADLPIEPDDAAECDEDDLLLEDGEPTVESALSHFARLFVELEQLAADLVANEYPAALPHVVQAITSIDAEGVGVRLDGGTLHGSVKHTMRESLDKWRLDVMLDALVFGKEALSAQGPDAVERFRAGAAGMLVELLAAVTMADIHAGRPHLFSPEPTKPAAGAP